MRIHFIAIGGSIMHALAIDTLKKGHIVTGSDDEIYEPSRSILEAHDLLPNELGWDAKRISSDIDLIVLGMHAKIDNPELKSAQALDITIMSFPEFIASMSKDKKRIVIAGSHGKTTTTSMIMHVLQESGHSFDYLVGARLDGFNNMVSVSDAPTIIIEGDEYLSSAIDKRPKIFHYQPDITVIAGIEWDHMNVFPTEEFYLAQFKSYMLSIHQSAKLYYCKEDKRLEKIAHSLPLKANFSGYYAHPYLIEEEQVFLKENGVLYPVSIFGEHNMQNLMAAKMVCDDLGVENKAFYQAIATFKGAHKRLETRYSDGVNKIYQDFAHAPSKVLATVRAVRSRHKNVQVIACLELHTYSSLNKAFLPQYFETMSAADLAFVYFHAHTFQIKKIPVLYPEEVQKAFGDGVTVFNDIEEMKSAVRNAVVTPTVLLFMSSGTFSGSDVAEFGESLF